MKTTLGMFVFLVVISSIVGGFLWPYSINTWLLFVGKHPAVHFWQGMLLGVIPYFGYDSNPVAVLTWI